MAMESFRKTEPTSIHTDLASLVLMSQDKVEEVAINSLQELTDRLAKHKGTSWLHVNDINETFFIHELCEYFKVHPLVNEDIIGDHQRPKIDIFPDYLYLLVKAPFISTPESRTEFNQVNLIVTPTILISVQTKQTNDFKKLHKRLLSGEVKVNNQGVDALAYLLLDMIVEDYFNIIEHRDDDIETLEDELITSPSSISLSQLYLLKREFIDLRKAIVPLREIFNTLLKVDESLVKQSTHLYIRDLYDHCIRFAEILDTYREMTTAMLEIYLSSINNKMNESIRILTIFAAIFIPLSFIGSLYGMNFDNMPELHWKYGYYLTLLLMALVAGGLLAYFRKKGWWGKSNI